MTETNQSGWATVSYKTEIESFSVTYGNGPSIGAATNPTVQYMWISNFTFSDEIIPTHAVINRVEASTTSGGTVLEWETGSEVGTAGFHVKRYDENKDRYVRINDELIPSVGEPQGGTYRFIDPTAISGEIYLYKLVELEYKGKKRRYGPYEVTVDGAGYGRADADDTESNKPPVPVGVAATSLATQPRRQSSNVHAPTVRLVVMPGRRCVRRCAVRH